VAQLTGLRRSRPGRIELEVDGQPWRVVPDDVVVRCRLAAGTELDRPLLRELRRELRRAEALAGATQALSRRDFTRRRLTERLRARGVRESEAEDAVTTLARAGLVDDERLARRRAQVLAERGWGDAAIEARLRSEAVPAEYVSAALAELTPESERAGGLAPKASDRRKAWALLARRGFSPETIEEVVGGLDEGPRTRLR
jgi:regulatory protein